MEISEEFFEEGDKVVFTEKARMKLWIRWGENDTHTITTVKDDEDLVQINNEQQWILESWFQSAPAL